MESYILQCKFTPSRYPLIESIEAPLPFRTIKEFEKWLREKYIPRTLATDYIDDPLTKMPFDVKKTECWGVFSANEKFECGCQTYRNTRIPPKVEVFLSGKILSHNHSSGDTLSLKDIFNWADFRIKECRAVTETDTFAIKPGKKGWPNPKELVERIKEICPSILSNVKNTGMARHRCFQQLDSEGVFQYIFY